jgi:threonine/homoserine/homoserine lactone efflux protein
LVAGLGLSIVTSQLVAASDVLRVVGTAYLIVLGVKTFQARPAQGAAASTTHAVGAWASTFALTITNPMTILSFAAMFSAIVLAKDLSRSGSALILPLGVFLGSAAWWLLLSAGVDRLRNRISDKQLQWINRGAGGLLLAFALASVIDFAARHVS